MTKIATGRDLEINVLALPGCQEKQLPVIELNHVSKS